MRKIVVPHEKFVKDEVIARVIHDSLHCLEKLHTVYTFLMNEPLQDYHAEEMPTGYMPEDYLLDKLRNATADIHIDYLTDARMNGWFGFNSQDENDQGALKFYKSTVLLEQFYQQVLLAPAYNPPTLEEWREECLNLRYGLGAMAYAMAHLLHIEEISEAILAREKDVSFDGVFRTLASAYSLSPRKITNFVRVMQSCYYTVVPAFEECPKKWFEICDSLDPLLVDAIVDLGNYVWTLDFKAVDNGDLVINENYISMLEERADRMDNGHCVPGDYPNQWATFQQNVPQEFAMWAIKTEPRLTIGMIDPILRGTQVTQEYVDFIEESLTSIEKANQEENNVRTEKFKS